MRSQKTQDAIMDIARESPVPITTRQVSERLGLSMSRVRDLMSELVIYGYLEKEKHGRHSALYTVSGMAPQPLKTGPIREEEIEHTKSKVCIGDRLRVWDDNAKLPGIGYGAAIVAEVVKKYPHIVQLDNGHSVTYAQLAQYYRDGAKGRCIR